MMADTARPVVLVGAGGHGRVLLDLLLALRRTVLGVVDPDPTVTDRLPGGVVRLGGDEVFESLDRSGVLLANGIGSVGRVDRRRTMFRKLTDSGFRFATLVHPSAVVATDVELGEGTQVMAGSIVQTGARIGSNVIVNTRASVDHDCRIGDHCHLAPGVVLSGGVLVGHSCHLGTGAIVIQNVTIGHEALIAAGAVVARAIAPGDRVGRSGSLTP